VRAEDEGVEGGRYRALLARVQDAVGAVKLSVVHD